MKRILKFPSKLAIMLINFYKKYISTLTTKKCIFYPTCSEYSKQAFEKYGFIKGSVLTIRRIIKCNPFSKGGVDLLK